MSTKARTPGPANDTVDQEALKFSGAVAFDEDNEDLSFDPRNLKREQLVRVTALGYITSYGEKPAQNGKKTITVGTWGFGAFRLEDVEIVAEPQPRARRGGEIPGSMTLDEEAGGKIEDALREEGFDVTIEVNGGDGNDVPPPPVHEARYGRASLTVGTDGNGDRIVLDGRTGEPITLEPSTLDDGPWRLANGQQGYVCGLLDPDTVAFASDGQVLAVPDNDFLFAKTISPGTIPALPEAPDEVIDPPPTDEERRADDDGPLPHDADPADSI